MPDGTLDPWVSTMARRSVLFGSVMVASLTDCGIGCEHLQRYFLDPFCGEVKVRLTLMAHLRNHGLLEDTYTSPPADRRCASPLSGSVYLADARGRWMIPGGSIPRYGTPVPMGRCRRTKTFSNANGGTIMRIARFLKVSVVRIHVRHQAATR
jgi:hypothetical protein